MRARQNPLVSDLEKTILTLVHRGVDDRLRALGVATACADYTSDALPSGTSRRVFHETLRSGAVGGAMKSGRVWSCPREAWHAARLRPATAPPRLTLVRNEPSIEELADLAMGIGGVR